MFAYKVMSAALLFSLSCASLLLNNGYNLKDVQEWMGHSDIQTTANIYGHLDYTRKQGLAEKLTSCLHGTDEKAC